MAKKQVANPDKTEPNKNNNKANPNVALGFVQQTQEELKKVVWPSRQQLISESAAVILMVTLVATTISLVNKLFSWGALKVF